MEGQCIHKYEAEIIGSVDHPYNFIVGEPEIQKFEKSGRKVAEF